MKKYFDNYKVKIKTILNIGIYLLITLQVVPVNSNSADWKYLGFSTIEKNSIFYIFIDKKTEKTSDGYLKIKQKHIFNQQQTLTDGITYKAVEFERHLDCSQKTIATVMATFMTENGKIIESYKAKKKAKMNIIANNTIDSHISDKLCSKNPRQ